MQVYLPDVRAKRVIKTGPQGGQTHRKLLPLLPRAKV